MPRNKRILYAIATVAWMALIFYLSSIPDLKSSLPSLADFILRKLAHFSEYAVLYALLWKTTEDVPKRERIALIITFLYAVSDEIHQGFVHGRVMSIIDVLIDACGGVFGYAIIQKPPRRR